MYQNYIFDFYGTLVDIHTDEERPALWKQMSQLYSVYGADYDPEQLKKAFYEQCRDAEDALQSEMNISYAEIDLTKIFIFLLKHAPKYHQVQHTILDMNEWVYGTANTFRILSRTELKTYPYTIQVLKRLKRLGCHVFILSNAQRIFTMPEMEQSGILSYADGVYISSDYRMKKPESEFLAELLNQERLKKDESVMIGNDCQSDIASAVSNQMHSIFLDTAKHDETERNEMISAAVHGHSAWMPDVIADGDIRKILRI